MRKSILLVTVLIFTMGVLFTYCNSPSQKVENAEANAAEAQEDLDQARQDYLEDVEVFKKQTEERIAANNKNIADFNARIETEKKEAKEEYKLKIAELEMKNSDMKKKLADYKVEGKDQWDMFKAEFNRDMDQLGNALKDLTEKNN